MVRCHLCKLQHTHTCRVRFLTAVRKDSCTCSTRCNLARFWTHN